MTTRKAFHYPNGAPIVGGYGFYANAYENHCQPKRADHHHSSCTKRPPCFRPGLFHGTFLPCTDRKTCPSTIFGPSPAVDSIIAPSGALSGDQVLVNYHEKRERPEHYKHPRRRWRVFDQSAQA